MDREEQKQRTKQFAAGVLGLAAALPKTFIGRMITWQLADAVASVGSNYRAACRARSRPEFVAKVGVVEEEGDESAYWMELTAESGLMAQHRVAALLQEADEAVAIMASSYKSTARGGATSAISNQKSEMSRERART